MTSMLRVTISIVFTTAVAICGAVSSVATPQNVTVRLPLSQSGSTCSFSGRDEISVSSDVPVVEVKCAARRQQIQCDGERVEPRDLPVPEQCGPRSVEFLPGIERRVSLEHDAAVDVDWLDVSAAGAPSIVARRKFQGPALVSLIVADKSTRLLRFTRNSASPVSVSASDLAATNAWVLPAAAPGGELVLIIDRATVMPTGFEIVGQSMQWSSVAAGRGIASLSALPSGSYEIRARYASGLVLKAASALVAASQSAIVRIPKLPVGGAAVRASDGVCRLASEFVLQSPDARDQGRDSAQVVWSSAPGTCSWNVSGLAPGAYEAFLRGPTGIIAFRRFDVSSQEVAAVSLADSSVNVDGKVSYNGSGVPNARIAFLPADGASEGATAQTDAYGFYFVTLPRNGAYTVIVGGAGVPEMRTARLVDGNNRFDVAIKGATTVRVHVSGATGDGSIQVQLLGRDANALWSVRGAGSIDDVAEWRGVPFGRYSVSARSGLFVSATTEFELTALQPTTMVELTLALNGSRLLVSDERGNPIEQSSVLVNGKRIEATSAGVYSLSGIPPGTPLAVRAAGFVPTCRRASAAEDVSVALTRGRPVKMQFNVSLATSVLESATLAGMPNSDCAVPLTAFDLQRVDAANGVFEVTNFPTASSLILATPSGSQAVTLERSGLVIVR